jgi:lysine decarboxylase
VKKNQLQTPFLDKLIEYVESQPVSMDVPGHKLGRLDNDFQNYVGVNTFKLDANAPRGLDNLSNPKGVIKASLKLMAEAFYADQAFFLTGGTSMGILAMIMTVCRAKEKIIMPRNVHKSAINALILSGAVPIFVKPEIDDELGIANHMSFEHFVQSYEENPDAKAVFVINPTYFGITSDLEKIIEFAHQKDMVVLADEAHGAHFAFSKALPKSAIKLGADMSASSLHKTVGSLTQSSILLTKGPRVSNDRVRSTLNMLQSTSPSSLLMASLDAARKFMVINGKDGLARTIKLADEARKQINKIPGIKAYGKDYFISKGANNFDETKLVIKVSNLGITGFDAYKIMRDQFNIQLELSETHLILAVLSIGNTRSDIEKLVAGLKQLSKNYGNQSLKKKAAKFKYQHPETFTRPRVAYHAPKKYVKLKEALNEIAAESVMIYPPGIPLVIPGEVVTKEIVQQINYFLKEDLTVLSDSKDGYIRIIDKEEWEKFDDYKE